MYHCHLQLYLVGVPQELAQVLKAIPPLERFTHHFLENAAPRRELAAQADWILAPQSLSGTLAPLAESWKPEARLVLLEDGARESLPWDLPHLWDLWPAAMEARELRLRFRRLQELWKLEVDRWQAEQLLEACINGSPNPVWFKDKDGVHVKVNESFCRMVGKTRQQVEGRRHAYIWDVEQDDPACIESEREVMRKRETCVADEVVQTRGGQLLLTTYKSPLYDVDGSVTGTVGVALDVTRERGYQREIFEKSRILELLFATMDCGMMCHSLDGKEVISVNQAALRLLGYQTQEEMMEDGFDLIAKSVLDKDKPGLRASITALKQVGDSVGTEYRVQHRDGNIVHILGNVKLIEEGGELLYQRFLLDVTAQKRLEAERWAQKDRELQYQEKLLEIFSTFLSDNVDDVYMLFDAAGEQAEFVSPNIERVLGIPWTCSRDNRQQIVQARDFIGGESLREELAALQPGMSLAPVETERENPKTGERKFFRESVSCVSVQGRKKIVVYISDRTKERKSQDALAEALNIAQVANKAKSTFLSNVSHDIRTPMNAIMGLVTLLREEGGSPERVKEYTQKIDAASQHLLGLINDVLDMNKIESGSAVLNISELNMAEIIDELNTIIRPQAREKKQTFEIHASSLACEHLLGDKLRINQIMINILSNAVKYTQIGGRIDMRISELPQVDKNYIRIRFEVEDNGQGMSEEYQKVIFDPFTREQEATRSQIQGTGLGMAITKSLVDLMGGTIRVESRLGRGSVFTVELELRIQERKDDPKFWDRHKIRRMLVADDSEDICLEIVKKMAQSGITTHYATCGSQAVDMIRTARMQGEPYDLILLDWKMPDLDGLETARRIRQYNPEQIPILLFTAYDWLDIERDALEVGIEHFLPKPFFLSSFKETIRRMKGTVGETQRIDQGGEAIAGKRVLVVDDIDVNRMILVKILTSLGAVCEEAENGHAAVEIFQASQEGEYDLILMDIQMPVMNGYEATRVIRSSSHPSAQSVAIIAMTANAFVDDIRDALESGMDGHIPKPIVLEQLKQTIQEVLERRGLGN